MKRMHVHVSVDDLSRSINFYSLMFGARPIVVEDDYAKWMLDDPRVNFAISARGHSIGVDHLGVQVETPEELHELAGRLSAAGETVLDQAGAVCCYARSDKSWVEDPAGLRWESFLTLGHSTTYGEDDVPADVSDQACCSPQTPQGDCCSPKAELAQDAPCCAA